MHGTPSGVPVLNSSGLVNGVYSLVSDCAFKISYNGRGRYPSKSNMTLAIDVVRSQINQESPQGIVIHDIQLVKKVGKNT